MRTNALQPTISLLEAKSEGALCLSIRGRARCHDSSNLEVISYVAALELRVEKLERRLAFARLRKASVARHDSEAGPLSMTELSRKDSLANIRDAIHRKAARRREDSDVNSLMAEFGFL